MINFLMSNIGFRDVLNKLYFIDNNSVINSFTLYKMID